MQVNAGNRIVNWGGGIRRLAVVNFMTLIMVGFLAYLIFSTNGNSANADSAIYTCKIKHVYSLSAEGLFSESNWESIFEGGEFIVSKDTGAISGETLTTILAKETRVINSGSDENSFKAVAYFEGQLQLIEIQEFRSDKNKPFVASSMGGAGIVTGMCQ